MQKKIENFTIEEVSYQCMIHTDCYKCPFNNSLVSNRTGHTGCAFYGMPYKWNDLKGKVVTYEV